MPTGVYVRKPGLKRHLSEEVRAQRRANMAKAKIASDKSPKSAAARAQNAKNAYATRAARALLKAMPVNAKAGDVFNLRTGLRRFTLIDEKPVRLESGQWEQKFEQSGRVTVYGITREYKGIVRLVWDYEPTLENLLKSPWLEDSNDKSGLITVSPDIQQ